MGAGANSASVSEVSFSSDARRAWRSHSPSVLASSSADFWLRTAALRSRRLAALEGAGMERVEAVEASEKKSEGMLGVGDAEVVGEGGDWKTKGARGGRFRGSAERGRGDGTRKVGFAVESSGLETRKNWTLSLDLATSRAS